MAHQKIKDALCASFIFSLITSARTSQICEANMQMFAIRLMMELHRLYRKRRFRARIFADHFGENLADLRSKYADVCDSADDGVARFRTTLSS